MRRSLVGLALGWLALAGMQAPLRRRPGAPLEMWRLDCGEVQFTDFNAFFSDTSEYPAGPKRLVGSCYLIRHGDHYHAVGHRASRRPGRQSQQQTRRSTATRSGASIVDQLARINVRPEQVTIVGISHYHFDHTGQAADFPRARLIMGAGRSRRAARHRPGVQREPLAPWLTGGGQVTEAPGDHDVFGDGSVTMLNLPGHTPGHRGLLVRLASGPVLLSGDIYHFTEQVERRGVPPFNTSRAETARLDGPVRPARPQPPRPGHHPARARRRRQAPRLPGVGAMKALLSARARRARDARARRACRSGAGPGPAAGPGQGLRDQLSRRADHRGQISVQAAAPVRAGRRDRRRGRGGGRGRRPAGRRATG